MVWNIIKIKSALGGKLIGNLTIKTIVCKTILLLPPEIIEYVTSKVWFFSTDEESWAYTFHGNDLKDKHIIYLSDELFKQDLSQIQYTIIHEIGHIILKHQNSIGRIQTQSEIRRQEIEADLFAKKYLS